MKFKKGRRKIVNKLSELQKAGFDASRVTLQEIQQDIVNDANENLYYGRPHGALLQPGEQRETDSIFNNWVTKPPILLDSKVYEATVYNKSPHAHFVERGTTGPIIPEKKPKLIWRSFKDQTVFNEKGWVTAFQVRGQRPRNYLQRAFDKQKNWLPVTLETQLRMRLQQFVG